MTRHPVLQWLSWPVGYPALLNLQAYTWKEHVTGHSENIWKFNMLPNHTPQAHSQNVSTHLNSLAHTFFFQLCSCRLVSTSTSSESDGNDTNHVLGRPGRRIQKKLHHLCFCLAPWQDQVVCCLGSKQTSPPRSVFSGEAWHKVCSNLLKAALLDSGPVFPFIL